jgi:hypothetical protein
MPKLCQIIAIVEDVKGQTKTKLTAAYHKLQQTKLLFGISRTYAPLHEDGVKLPAESTLVQVLAKNVVDETAKYTQILFDICATRDWGNCEASADVVVDGKVLLTKAPVPFLLFLSKQLEDLHTFVEKLPVLDPSEAWSWDTGTDCYRTQGRQTIKTSKKPVAFVKVQATKEHPAQVDIVQQDIAEGTWSEVKFSGALPASTVIELVSRVEKLQAAVLFAKEEANSIAVSDKSTKPMFDFLFGNIPLGV